MVDVTDGSHVHVRLCARVLCLRHCYSLLTSSSMLLTSRRFLPRLISELPDSDEIPCCRRRDPGSWTEGPWRNGTCCRAAHRRAPPAWWRGLPSRGSDRGATTGHRGSRP